MAVTPVLFEQIEKFHCLNPSTTQGLSTGTLRLHVACVTCPQMCCFLKFKSQNPSKPIIFEFNEQSLEKYTNVQ